MSSVPVKLGYNDCVLKTLKKDAYIGIHKKVAALMIQKGICIAFDVANFELDFVSIAELGNEKPNFKQRSTIKKLLEKDEDTPMKSNNLFINPFKILISKKADDFFKSNKIFWAHGKVIKLKNFKGDFDSMEALKKTLGQGTIWCLCPKDLEKRSLAMTNPDGIEGLTLEEQEKCKLYVSIMKNELAKLTDIPYFKESCELASSIKENN